MVLRTPDLGHTTDIAVFNEGYTTSEVDIFEAGVLVRGAAGRRTNNEGRQAGAGKPGATLRRLDMDGSTSVDHQGLALDQGRRHRLPHH